jgi:hypothetical protein
MHRLSFVFGGASALAIGFAGLFTVTLHASDRVAVYARVDRVVLTPNAEKPQTIQIFGVFSLAVPNKGNDYQPPARGYLYFALGGNESLARREWTDLKEIAGTKQIVAFGNRYQLKPRVRPATERAESPDTYMTGMGVTKVDGHTDYAPIRTLVDFRN